ncbi:MAG: hypothetical protein DWP97_00360 [Calditrichaeota bacterium]|nr:MAG: hypothetical protein DWP97_00360 [Calditrichota bacterium]
MKLIIRVILFFAVSAVSIEAFDSERDRFVVGGGLGYAPLVQTEAKYITNSKATASGVGYNLFAGYGYNDNAMFGFFKEGIFTETETIFTPEEKVHTGFTGAGVIFYFDDVGESFFINSAAGIIHFSKRNNTEYKHDASFGYLFGMGYEFAEHFQFYASMTGGKTESPTVEWEHTNIKISLRILAY